MWTANAATVAPSEDTTDGRLHLVPANLTSMLHRSVETAFTTRVLRRVFADPAHFVVHDPLPAADLTSDEGAANHTRLSHGDRALHLFGWGRGKGVEERPIRHPARQTREASEAVARLLALRPELPCFGQQHPSGIDQGAFHTDVLAVGNDGFLMLHEQAFRDSVALLGEPGARLGGELSVCVATERELSVGDAVRAYPFNSQLVTLPGGETALIAPTECAETPSVKGWIDRHLASNGAIRQAIFVDVRQSMANGGGPACLRLRVQCDPADVDPRFLLDPDKIGRLEELVARAWPESVVPAALQDAGFIAQVEAARRALLDALDLGELV